MLGVDFEEEADTVGGWLIATLGRFPREGDSVEIGDYRATVVAQEGLRIGLVRFEERSGRGGRFLRRTIEMSLGRRTLFHPGHQAERVQDFSRSGWVRMSVAHGL